MRQEMNSAMSNLTGVAARKGLKVITAAASLEPYERHVRCSTSGAGAYAITLQPAEVMIGAFVFIDLTLKNTDDVTITAGDRGSDIVLNATGEHVLLYSTGVEWIVPYAIGPTIS